MLFVTVYLLQSTKQLAIHEVSVLVLVEEVQNVLVLVLDQKPLVLISTTMQETHVHGHLPICARTILTVLEQMVNLVAVTVLLLVRLLG